MVELSSGLLKTNPASDREEDLNPGPPDNKSSALTTRPRRLPCRCNCSKTEPRIELSHKILDFHYSIDCLCTVHVLVIVITRNVQLVFLPQAKAVLFLWVARRQCSKPDLITKIYSEVAWNCPKKGKPKHQ